MIIHKQGSKPILTRCGKNVFNTSGLMMSKFWNGVTCKKCLKLKKHESKQQEKD